MNRRSLVRAAALAATAGLAIHQSKASHVPYRRPRRSHVAVLNCDSYERTPQVVEHGLQLVRPSVQGKSVLLKPNLVEYIAGGPHQHTSDVDCNRSSTRSIDWGHPL